MELLLKILVFPVRAILWALIGIIMLLLFIFTLGIVVIIGKTIILGVLLFFLYLPVMIAEGCFWSCVGNILF